VAQNRQGDRGAGRFEIAQAALKEIFAAATLASPPR
jgi:hypothetical protein